MDFVFKALGVLRERPLCDRCLGRFFARLGYGWSNLDRGSAIKRVIVMYYHWRVKSGDRGALEEFLSVAPNIGVEASGLYRLLTGGDLGARPCSICGGVLESFLDKVAGDVAGLLRVYGVRRFIIGVKPSGDILGVEEEIASKHSLDGWESIKNEIKREVGKRVESLGFTADFTSPEAMVIIGFPGGGLEIIVNSLILAGRYWKRGRLVSQAYWPSFEGAKYYSIEEALTPLLRIAEGESIVFHAAGREDVDARMLGTGRPVLVEVKAPRVRELDFSEVERAVQEASKGLVAFKFEGYANRSMVKVYKEEATVKSKVYKALIAVRGGIEEGELARLEEALRGAAITQRTPLRILRRKKDITRAKKVYEVKCRILGGPLIECLIKASGGLYVKELISGDNGRTRPSFTEILGREASCLELDVLLVTPIS